MRRSLVALAAVIGLAPLAPLAAQGGAPPVAPALLLNNASFETGWDGFTNWTGAGTPFGVTRDSTLAFDGKWSIKREWTPNPNIDGGSQFLYHFGSTPNAGGVDRIWLRFYFRLTAPVSTIMKFARFYDAGFGQNLGGFFLQSGDAIIGWGWDVENQAIVSAINVKESQVIDGKWHSLEVDYWRNGDPSGQPSAAFWFDGSPQGYPDGSKYGTGYWSHGRLYAGGRGKTNQMGYMEWLGTLNRGNTTTGQVNIDRIAYSTKGPIGR